MIDMKPAGGRISSNRPKMLCRCEKNSAKLFVSWRSGCPSMVGACVSARLVRTASRMRTATAAMAMNGMRQPQCVVRNAPILGAMTGAAVKIMVISDIRRAASRPLDTSRTMERDSTIAAAAPSPWTKRAASMTAMEFAAAATKAAMVKMSMPV